ncbi:hypothetical protein [Rhizobium deserti]|uniref:hypothetical protein n=1 Tax=Rhizobium deserti TaxID=2547961 RepID=UPI001FDF373B|nr:hypothetical protein [Rhizobium deserti]
MDLVGFENLQGDRNSAQYLLGIGIVKETPKIENNLALVALASAQHYKAGNFGSAVRCGGHWPALSSNACAATAQASDAVKPNIVARAGMTGRGGSAWPASQIAATLR